MGQERLQKPSILRKNHLCLYFKSFFTVCTGFTLVSLYQPDKMSQNYIRTLPEHIPPSNYRGGLPSVLTIKFFLVGCVWGPKTKKRIPWETSGGLSGTFSLYVWEFKFSADIFPNQNRLPKGRDSSLSGTHKHPKLSWSVLPNWKQEQKNSTVSDHLGESGSRFDKPTRPQTTNCWGMDTSWVSPGGGSSTTVTPGRNDSRRTGRCDGWIDGSTRFSLYTWSKDRTRCFSILWVNFRGQKGS